MDDHLGKAIDALQKEPNRMDEDGKLLKCLLLVKLLADLNIEAKNIDPRLVEVMLHSLLLNPDTERRQCLQLDY